MMLSDLIGLLIILVLAQVSTNLTLIMLGESTLLAWLNQTLLGVYSIAVISYFIMRGSAKGTIERAEDIDKRLVGKTTVKTIHAGAHLLALTAIIVRLLSILMPEEDFAATNSLYEGMYIIAVAATVTRLLAASLPRLPMGRLIREEHRFEIAQYSQSIAFIAALWGTIGVAISFLTGAIFYTSGEASKSPIVMNKVMMVIFSLTLWIDFLVINMKFGDKGVMWRDKVLQLLYPLTSLGGFFFAAMAGSFGDSFTRIGGFAEPTYQLFHIQKSELWVIPAADEFSKAIVNSSPSYLASMAKMPLIIGVVNLTILVLVLAYVASEEK